MAIALGNIRDLLLPGLMEITGEYKDLPNLYSKVFKARQSNMQIEKSVQTRFMPLAQYKTEGGATHFDNNAGERWTYSMEPVEVGLGYAITRKAIDDNLYKSQFKPTALGLGKSFNQFWEIQAWSVFNSATTYNTQLGGDGVALCSTAHPYDYGTWANRPSTDQDLNETSWLNAINAIRSNFVDEAGLKIYARADTLVVPISLQQVAIRLVKTELRPGTANNDVNAGLFMDGTGHTKMLVSDYLTSNYAWFLTTNIEGLVQLNRVAYETDMWVDNVTDNLLVKAYERRGYFYNDPRCLYGSFPTS